MDHILDLQNENENMQQNINDLRAALNKQVNDNIDVLKQTMLYLN